MDIPASLSDSPATAKRGPMTDAPARPEARSPRGFMDRRARDLVAERKILAAVSEVVRSWQPQGDLDVLFARMAELRTAA